MNTHLYEHSSGVTLQVEYELENDEVEFHSIRVLGDSYRAVGPDIAPMLHKLVIIADDERTGERILSQISKEILGA